MANISSPMMGSFPDQAKANNGPIPVTRDQASEHVFDVDADIAGPESPGKDRGRGALDQSIGSTKETIGKIFNSDKLVEKGAKQREAGFQQEQKALRRDDSESFVGAVDRGVKGVMDKITPDHKEEDVPTVSHPAFGKQDELF